jgi:integrase
MPSGAAVIRYEGARGVVWRIKYRDAGGKQVMETVGSERDGITRKHAEAELRERLVRVDRGGYVRPDALAFETWARAWLAEGERKRAWKPSTVLQYRLTVNHLVGHFEMTRLDAIRPRDVSGYIDSKLKTDEEADEGRVCAKTLQLHLNVLHNLFKTAIADEFVRSNPVAGVERPKVKRRKWRILKPEEVSRVALAFTDEQARLMYMTLVLTGLRRFELLDLRWRDLDLIASRLRVAESKSEEGERSIALSPMLAEALWQHRRASRYQGDEERVFCHPERGSRIGTEWFADQFRAALKKAGITDYVRPFHDLRHASLTNGVMAGEQPLELMARAGHRSMATTRQYLHLAGVVCPERAAALEDRLLAGRTFYRSEMTSADPAESEAALGAVTDPA